MGFRRVVNFEIIPRTMADRPVSIKINYAKKQVGCRKIYVTSLCNIVDGIGNNRFAIKMRET